MRSKKIPYKTLRAIIMWVVTNYQREKAVSFRKVRVYPLYSTVDVVKYAGAGVIIEGLTDILKIDDLKVRLGARCAVVVPRAVIFYVVYEEFKDVPLAHIRF